ncbi:MAG: thiamine pyrophosphate-binding protein [Mycobacteriales bacterium]
MTRLLIICVSVWSSGAWTAIYGFTGDGINGILGALRRHQDRLRFSQTRHEEMAAFMACGHSKYTGKVAVCMATSGRGRSTCSTGCTTRSGTTSRWWRPWGRHSSARSATAFSRRSRCCSSSPMWRRLSASRPTSRPRSGTPSTGRSAPLRPNAPSPA